MGKVSVVVEIAGENVHILNLLSVEKYTYFSFINLIKLTPSHINIYGHNNPKYVKKGNVLNLSILCQHKEVYKTSSQ